eukprot:6176004-Pleurochrysis_carterae.AAC.2
MDVTEPFRSTSFMLYSTGHVRSLAQFATTIMTKLPRTSSPVFPHQYHHHSIIITTLVPWLS